MKLIITRHESGWGGPEGSAVIDLDNETICYFDCMLHNNEEIFELLENGTMNPEEIDISKENIKFLKEELEKGYEKNIDPHGFLGCQEDYILLEKNGELDIIYKEGIESRIFLNNREVNIVLKRLIELVE